MREDCVRNFPMGRPRMRCDFRFRERGGIVKIVWILEKDHSPVEHGFLEYTESTGAFVAEPAGVLAVQARVFVENYLRR